MKSYRWWLNPGFADPRINPSDILNKIPLAIIYCGNVRIEFNPMPLTNFEKVIESKLTRWFIKGLIPFWFVVWCVIYMYENMGLK